jgi:hypothetical protein
MSTLETLVEDLETALHAAAEEFDMHDFLPEEEDPEPWAELGDAAGRIVAYAAEAKKLAHMIEGIFNDRGVGLK